MKESIERREFLRRVAVFAASTSAILSAQGCATGLAIYEANISQGKIDLLLSNYPELKEVGGAIELDVPQLDDRILVVKSSSNSYVALSPICTHLGCTVRREPSFFRCPCHGSTYTLEGDVVRGPAQQPLHSYPVHLSYPQLMIKISA